MRCIKKQAFPKCKRRKFINHEFVDDEKQDRKTAKNTQQNYKNTPGIIEGGYVGGICRKNSMKLVVPTTMFNQNRFDLYRKGKELRFVPTTRSNHFRKWLVQKKGCNSKDAESHLVISTDDLYRRNVESFLVGAFSLKEKSPTLTVSSFFFVFFFS